MMLSIMALRTSNPTLSDKTFNRYAYLTGANPETLMTINGTLNKCLILAIVAVTTGIVGWFLAASNSAIAIPALVGSSVLGLIACVATCIKPQWAPTTAPIYAALEGVALGVISQILNAIYPGIALQAALITAATMTLMLGLYRSGILRATPLFKKVVIISTVSIGVVYLASIIALTFGTRVPYLNDVSAVGIGISVFICVVAALNFILDFDTIETGAKNGAPKFMEWYAAFGLMVTVFWLYVEVLRLLAKLRR